MNPLDLSHDAPWKKRFRAPTVQYTSIAPLNRQRGLAVSNQSGVYQLYAWDVKTGRLRQITDKPAGVVFGGISPDGAYIIYHDDQQGNEIGHYVRVPFDGDINTPREDITPDMPPYASLSASESLNGQWFGYTVADQSGFNMLMLPKNPDGTLGQAQVLYRSQALSFGPMFSYDGDYAVIATTERSQSTDTCLMAFDLLDKSQQQNIKILQEETGTIQPVAFAPLPGDTRLLAVTDATGFNRPLVWDVVTGDRIDIPLPDIQGDINAWGWSPDGKRILLFGLNQAVYQIYVYDLENSQLNILAHLAGVYSAGYFYDDETIYINYQDSTQPAKVVAMNAQTGTILDDVLKAGEAPSGVKWRSVNFSSSDGVKAQAWLAVPNGEGPFPMIMHMHGGPTAVQTETFSPSAQMWVDHGFAWMSVNYRGSTTFGRDFQHAIYGMLGHREVDDMAAAYHWAVANGIAQPDAVILTGASYGGYLTLQCLGKTPALWAGGIAVVAIADWFLMYEDQAETLRGYQKALFGGSPDELPEIHRNASPITYVENVSAPVLVIQGANDTRCPARQMRVYEEKMRQAGKDIHVHWFDAGHGSRAMAQDIEHHELMLQWVYRVLG